jgi:hypothetical protein
MAVDGRSKKLFLHPAIAAAISRITIILLVDLIFMVLMCDGFI